MKGVEDEEYVQLFQLDKKSRKPRAVLYADHHINDLQNLLGSGTEPSTVLGIDKVINQAYFSLL